MLGQSIEDINLCINFRRNRRQNALKNISFESEVFNIYDPSFTSEEEMDSMIENKKAKKIVEDMDSFYDDDEDDDEDLSDKNESDNISDEESEEDSLQESFNEEWD